MSALTGPIFVREALAHARRPRTYAFQTLFLAGLVFVLLPLWPSGAGEGARAAASGRLIFEYGTLFEMILIALLAPALTANAITAEKDKNTLELLILTDAGPFSIIFQKLLARVSVTAFLLFLSLPVIFALLTLGGIDAKAIGISFAILLSTVFVGASLGVFLSTILRKTTLAIVGGYVVFALYLAGPAILNLFGLLSRNAGSGTYDPRMAWLSPWYDLQYLFRPASFVPLQSFPSHWWINPLGNVVAGFALASLAGALLPSARTIDRAFGLRPVFEVMDRALAVLAGSRPAIKAVDDAGRALEALDRPGPTGNPIYWKETTVNTMGRLRYWMRVNLLIALLMVGSYAAFSAQLGNIVFHKIVGGVLSGLIVITATMIAATSVSKEREERTLFVLATTPVDCGVYVKGKVQGILRNLAFLLLLPLIHVALFVGTGVITWQSLAFVILGVPVAAISAIVQGTFISLVFPTTLRAITWALVLILVEALLPICTCLHTFNPVLLLYYAIESPNSGGGPSFASGNLGSILFLSSVFSVLAHVGLTSVVYSLMRSGFDRYLGRAG